MNNKLNTAIECDDYRLSALQHDIDPRRVIADRRIDRQLDAITNEIAREKRRDEKKARVIKRH